MRVIKFRAWDKLSKSMRYGAEDNLLIITRNPQDFELMQFTGLVDRRGFEIWEGDVLYEEHPEGDDKGQVMWVDGGFDLIGADGVTALGPQVIWGNYEILGNIYEHPELVK